MGRNEGSTSVVKCNWVKCSEVDWRFWWQNVYHWKTFRSYEVCCVYGCFIALLHVPLVLFCFIVKWLYVLNASV